MSKKINYKLTGLLVALLVGYVFSPISSSAQSSVPNMEIFFKNPKIFNVKLSPDGSSIAMLVTNKDNRIMLATMNMGDATPKVIVYSTATDVDEFHWVNNNRIVYDLWNHQLGVGDYVPPGLFAINKDGGPSRQLVERNFQFIRNDYRVVEMLPWNTFFFDVIPGGESDDIYMQQIDNIGEYRGRNSNLLRVNTVTGRAEPVKRPGKVSDWLIDTNGVARIATIDDKSNESIYYKDLQTNSWRKLAEFPFFSSAGFTPIFLGPDNSLLVNARKEGRDTSAIYRYDLKENKMDEEPLIALKGYDFSGKIIYNREQKKILGVRHEMDARSTTWFDPEMKQAQIKLDAQLPSTANLISVAEGKKSDTALVYSFSDTVPGIWRLYNMRTGNLTTIGNTRPDVDPAQMAYKDMVRYRARDGLEIPAYLTLPRGKQKNLPMIVMVHGGPWVRGVHWDWDAEVQFLASRGYAVLEPEFRGSTGYGMKLFSAGWKQWGLAMQDDIADGARWSIQQGYADPKRICIAGASYGGYSAVMGLINDPDLFKCGINWVGVTDINLFYGAGESDMSEEAEKYGLPILVGDQIKDAEQFKATSPLLNASRIKQPLLLAYGGSDRRVPIAHGTRLYSAAKSTNPNVEWVEYPEEGHGFFLLKNKIDFWSRVEKFLHRNLGPS